MTRRDTRRSCGGAHVMGHPGDAINELVDKAAAAVKPELAALPEWVPGLDDALLAIS